MLDKYYQFITNINFTHKIPENHLLKLYSEK